MTGILPHQAAFLNVLLPANQLAPPHMKQALTNFVRDLLIRARENWLQEAVNWIAPAAVGSYLYTYPDHAKKAISSVGTTEASILIMLLIAGHIAFARHLLWLSRYRHLKYQWGVLWNKEHEPHCPKCRCHLGNYGSHPWSPDGILTYDGFQCSECGRIWFLTDQSGSHTTISRLQTKILGKEWQAFFDSWN